jgi:hypothetical protein
MREIARQKHLCAKSPGPPLTSTQILHRVTVQGHSTRGQGFRLEFMTNVALKMWGVFVVGSVDNVLRPFVVGARVKQHPMLIALAAIGGTYAFGVLGILLGPLVVSLVAALLEEIQKLVSARGLIEIDESHFVERDCTSQ